MENVHDKYHSRASVVKKMLLHLGANVEQVNAASIGCKYVRLEHLQHCDAKCPDICREAEAQPLRSTACYFLRRPAYACACVRASACMDVSMCAHAPVHACMLLCLNARHNKFITLAHID